MDSSVFAAVYCFTRNQVGKTVATVGIDTQACSPAVADKRVGAYDCPNWDDAGTAKVVFLPQRGSKPVSMVFEESLTIFHDGHRGVEVCGFVPRQADMRSATFKGVLDDFRVHGGTYAI